MMALAGVELETLVSEPDALTTRPPPCAYLFYFFYKRSICIIDNGVNRRRTRNARFRARRADHSTTDCKQKLILLKAWLLCFRLFLKMFLNL